MLLIWTENLHVGIEEFDADHRNLIAQANALHAAIKAGNSHAALALMLEQLESHAKGHCAREEEVMLETGYPELEEHKAEHAWFFSKLQEMKMRFEREPDEMLSAEVMVFIFDWVGSHINNTDKKYRDHFLAHGIF